MAWHRFKVKGKHYMTKHMRTLDIIACSDVSAKQKAITKKLLPPFICEEVPFDPPADKLLERAKAAGISVPDNASSDDVAALIERGNDTAPPAGLMAFAERWDIYFSPYIGNKSLYNIIFKNLQLETKAAFFIFSVYKFLSSDKKSNLETHPYRDIFYKFAADNDKSLSRSIANYKGEHLCAFGSAENLPAGYKAGGTRTIAYKAASSFIKKYFNEEYSPFSFTNDNSRHADAVSSSNNTPKQKTSVVTAVNTESSIKNSKPAADDQKASNSPPSIFIISKNDTFIPTKAIELKSKIVKIPDLENKASADLPVYSPKIAAVKNSKRRSYAKQSKKKSANKSGCLPALAVLAVILLIIFSLLF